MNINAGAKTCARQSYCETVHKLEQINTHPFQSVKSSFPNYDPSHTRPTLMLDWANRNYNSQEYIRKKLFRVMIPKSNTSSMKDDFLGFPRANVDGLCRRGERIFLDMGRKMPVRLL